MRILVTGVRGKTGREVVRQLAGSTRGPSGYELLGGTADPDSLDVPDVTPVAFDWQRPDTWPRALDGVDAVYLVRPDIESAPEGVRGVVAGAPPDARVVLLSELGAERMPSDSWAVRVERAVTDHVRSWTVLRPSWFMQVFTDARFYRDAIATHGRITLPAGQAEISWVDARDIAAVAVRALVDHGHAGRSYTPTGPRAVSLAETVALLTAATGREIKHDDAKVSEAVAGLDPWTAELVADVYERVIDGGFAPVTDDVERVTGQPTRTLEAFVAEHTAAWRISQAGPVPRRHQR